MTKRVVFGVLMVTALLVPARSLAGQAPASQASPQAEQLQERLQELEARLSLTPEQKERLRPVLAEELQRLKALREKSQGGVAGRRKRRKLARELREIQSDADRKLKAILSEAQMAELKKIREERRQQIRDRAQGR
jgi:hypothetical protein